MQKHKPQIPYGVPILTGLFISTLMIFPWQSARGFDPWSLKPSFWTLKRFKLNLEIQNKNRLIVSNPECDAKVSMNAEVVASVRSDFFSRIRLEEVLDTEQCTSGQLEVLNRFVSMIQRDLLIFTFAEDGKTLIITIPDSPKGRSLLFNRKGE